MIGDAAEESIQPANQEAWREWLRDNHARLRGVWLVLFKKASDRRVLTVDDAVEEALCFGWIDSLPRKLDDQRTQLYFAPRRPGTGWSRVNKERVARLEAAGRIEPPGQAKIDAARRDGSWAKLDAVELLEIPPDLASALAGLPPAAECFAAFPRSVRRGILEWILQAKRAETRARRIDETARLAQENRRANQWPR
jgi:uncharacterized protein YdeI (YjbR/CyaY-like superfamily)